jgi:hypothetical protein
VTVAWFPDTTVLCNFACVDQLPLLRTVLDGRGRWVEAIAYEVSRSARVYPALAGVAAEGWLGTPVEVTDTHEIAQVERIRRAVFGGRRGQPLRHLGEAQTCYVIQHWPDFAGSSWLSDDRESLRYARGRGIPVMDTTALVGLAVAAGHLDRRTGYELLCRMVAAGRFPRIPARPDLL